jgi:CBS domain containing-hemolysin-like protein
MNEPPLSIAIKIAGVFALVLLNAFFVGAEFALVSVRRERLIALAKSGSRAAQSALRLIQDPSAFISVVQFGVTVTSLVIGSLGEHAFADLFNRILMMFHLSPTVTTTLAFYLATPLAFIVLTFLHVVLGELAPKTIALERSQSVALWSAIPVELIYKIFYPFIGLLNFSGKMFLRLLGVKSGAESDTVYTEEEIRQLIAVSHKQGHLIAEEQEMIDNVFNFTDTVVREVMVPRPEIVAIEVSTNTQSLTEMLENSGYSRLPVYRENLDNIVGVIHTKDVFRNLMRQAPHPTTNPTSTANIPTIKDLMRQPLFVPESAQLVEVLKQMRRARNQMAVVMNEHGGVEGIVSMEDLLEEIVGEIRDEHDHDEEQLFYQAEDGSVIADGAMSIREANRKLNLNLPESDDYNTIAGFLIAKAGRILTQGETVTHQEATFLIEKVERHRILQVRIPKTSQTVKSSQQMTIN